MAATLGIYIFNQYLLNDGTPNNAGTITAYAAGTTNKKDIFADAAGLVPLDNPFTLSAGGRKAFYCEAGAYDFLMKDSAGNTIDTVEDYSSAPSFADALLKDGSVVADFLSIGSNPASAGALRLSNNEYIGGRNQANSADYRMMKIDTSDNLALMNDNVIIDSSGNVGIGTDSPGNLLSLRSSIGEARIDMFSDADGDGGHWSIYPDTSSVKSLNIYDNIEGALRLVIGSSGNFYFQAGDITTTGDITGEDLSATKIISTTPLAQAVTADNTVLNSDITSKLLVASDSSIGGSSRSCGLKAGVVDGQQLTVIADRDATAGAIFEIINGIGGTATVDFGTGTTLTMSKGQTAEFVWIEASTAWYLVPGNGVVT